VGSRGPSLVSPNGGSMVYCILYCVLYQDYDAMATNVAEHGGMKVLQDLRSLQRKLTGVKPF
jgi:hypothetical protein